MPHVASAEPVAVITAVTEATETTRAGSVSFAVSNPPTPTDLARWADLLASSPALARATWSAGPGSDVRR